MRVCVWALLALFLAASCGHWRPVRRAEHDPEPAVEPEPPQERVARPPGSQPASQPTGEEAGLQALQRWTRECYENGLRYDPVFAKGGRLLVRWRADRLGRLLTMDFAIDSFRGWALNASGDTLADCVVGRARNAHVKWSLSGSAPLRLEPQP